MKKILSILFTVLLFISCGKNSKDTEGKVVLKVAGWNVAAKSLGEIGELYEKEHPNVDIQIVEIDDTYTKITPALASGSGAPDVIQTQARDIQALYEKFPDQFYDITELMKKDGLDQKFLASSIDNVTKDGKIYAMPWDIGPVAVFYRTDMFEKAGVNPESIVTWDDFIAAGKKVQEANPGVVMTGYTKSADIFHMFYNQLGGTYVKDGKLNLKSPEAKKALELVVKLDKEGVSLDVADWNGRIVALNNNKIATVIFPVWYVGTLVSGVPDQAGKWATFPIPQFENGLRQSSLGGSTLTISNQSKNPDIAYDFIKFALATNEGEDVMIKYGLFPSYTPYYETENFKKINEYFGYDINSYFANLTNEIPPVNFGKIMLDASPILNNIVSSVLGGQNIDDALKEASESISKLSNIEENK